MSNERIMGLGWGFLIGICLVLGFWIHYLMWVFIPVLLFAVISFGFKQAALAAKLEQLRGH